MWHAGPLKGKELVLQELILGNHCRHLDLCIIQIVFQSIVLVNQCDFVSTFAFRLCCRMVDLELFVELSVEWEKPDRREGPLRLASLTSSTRSWRVIARAPWWPMTSTLFPSLSSKSASYPWLIPRLASTVSSCSSTSTGLGWKFRFLVPISGTPIGSGIPIPFLILKIPVGIFFSNSAVE